MLFGSIAMSSPKENPLQAFFSNALSNAAQFVQAHLSHLLPTPPGEDPLQSTFAGGGSRQGPLPPLFAISARPPAANAPPAPLQLKEPPALTKEELGRATWTLLHMVAAQYPDEPTRQQKKDVKELMAILSRLYPCKECADHFKEVLKANPVQAGSQAAFSQWMCHIHNVINRSLGKQIFPCQRVDARWGKLDCKDRACDVQGTSDLSI